MTVDENLRAAASDLLAETSGSVDSEAALDRLRSAPEAAEFGDLEAIGIESAVPAPITGWRQRRPGRGILAAAAAVVVVVSAVITASVWAGDATGEESVAVAPRASDLDRTDPPRSWGAPITVSPDTALLDGDVVAVTASGVEPGEAVVFAQCTAEALEEPDSGGSSEGWTASLLGSRCVFDSDSRGPATSGGTFSADLEIQRQVSLALGVLNADCAVFACAVVAIGLGTHLVGDQLPAYDEMSVLGAVEITFDPSPARGEPLMEVLPNEGLIHGQRATVNLVGATGETFETVRICTATDREVCAISRLAPWGDDGEVCDVASGSPESVCGPSRPVEIGSDGTASGVVRLWRAFPGPDGVVDCAHVRCELVITHDTGRITSRALGFAPAPLPPAPTLRLEPSDGLRPGDPVRVRVEGLTPGVEVSLHAGERTDEGGRYTRIVFLVADDDGRLDQIVEAVDPAGFGADCSIVGRCSVSLGPTVPAPFGDPMVALAEAVPVSYAPG